jgi:type IX secretion system substrate protein
MRKGEVFFVPRMKIKLSLRQRVSQSIKQKGKIALAAAMGGFAIFTFIVFLTYDNVGIPKTAIAAPGKDGIKTISTANVIVNEFTTLTNNASNGNTQIVVANSFLNTNGRFGANLASGDLILIIQVQGASINSSNSSAWGAVTAYNNAGNFEFAEVASIASSTKINLVSGLSKNYTTSGAAQVVRVPRYRALTITSSGSVTSQAWNGSTGGVLAMEVNGATVIDGTINVSGLGFRGGSVQNNSACCPGDHTDFVTSGIAKGGEKGEGIAGNATAYYGLGGRYGRGAPANGGGGGNSHNASGGGGANAGAIAAWNGSGIPDTITNASWKTAWDLEAANFHKNNSTGGGRGGYTYSQATKNPITLGPNSATWGGDSRYNVGGYGGRPLNNSGGKIFMGGGGGAGDSNDNLGTSGGNGGGIVYLLSYGTVSGTGTINANGSGAGNSTSTASNQNGDGSGGGGGGGSVYIYTKGALISNLKINAKGGIGGTQDILGLEEAEGGGGGGGGGYICTTNNVSLTLSVSGGRYGATNSGPLINFLPNGATSGAPGTIALNPAFPYSSGGALPVDLVSFNGTIKENKAELAWTTVAEINNDYFTIEKSSDGITFRDCAKIEGAGNTTSVRDYRYDDLHPAEGINYYRLKQTDFNGRTEYFEILSVNFQAATANEFEIKEILPNPFKNDFTVGFNSDVESIYDFELLDINGKIVASDKFITHLGFNNYHFTPVTNLLKGVYFARLINGNISTKTFRIVKR